MSRLLLSFLLVSFLVLCFSQGGKNNTGLLQDYMKAEKIFQQAQRQTALAAGNEKLYAKADSLYLEAGSAFSLLIPAADKEKNDSLSFLVRLRTALIASYFDSITIAKKNYLEAITLRQNLPAIPDSILFEPYLYLGGICYIQNQFDSALLFYKKAEALNNPTALPGSERLYSRMGTMYFETGDHRQAGNYFEKAISLTSPSDTDQLVNYKINIASMLVKLEEYKKARSVYEELLSYDLFTGEINHNLGIIHNRQQEYREGIGFFRKVNYPDSKKNIDLFYNYAIAWAGLHEKDSSAFYLEKAIAENIKWNGQKKNISYGLILLFKASVFSEKKEYDKALETLQEAIMQFDPDFNEKDVYKNPAEFGGVYAYTNLFNALIAKAGIFDSLYSLQKEQKLLEASLDTYRSAFDLAGHAERTYNSDEARLFIGRVKYAVHNKPIDASLRLYDLTQKKIYLEDAYRFDQQNKASVLLLNLQENEQKRNNPDNKTLLDEEAAIKSSITRLLLRSSRATDTLQLQAIRSLIRDHGIRLGSLQEKMTGDPAYQQLVALRQVPFVSDIQKKLDNKTVLLSYHLSANELLVLLISGNRFDYYKTPITPSFFTSIDSFKQYLATPGKVLPGNSIPVLLYKTLITPAQAGLSNKERLIIIPGDELNYLPFEALEDENGNYLVQQFSISYQFSTALFEKNSPQAKSTHTLAFAPFTSGGFSDSSGTRLPELAASKEEISGLKGKILTDRDASKRNFLANVNHYRIIHLATHANADNKDPSRSFIAFYPNDPGDYKLYTPEIYDLDLDSTELVILSACGTGTGQLVNGEGLMSLSGAFAYAGCPNIITSLWKAEDKTTSFITQRLHFYLEKGWTKDKSLQQAKLDLLKSNDIDPRFKRPGYWAHLVFIGDYEPDHRRNNWWKIALVIIIIASVYLFVKKKAWS